jgi:hypothetical protein
MGLAKIQRDHYLNKSSQHWRGSPVVPILPGSDESNPPPAQFEDPRLPGGKEGRKPPNPQYGCLEQGILVAGQLSLKRGLRPQPILFSLFLVLTFYTIARETPPRG